VVVIAVTDAFATPQTRVNTHSDLN